MKRKFTIIVQQFDENDNPIGEMTKYISQDKGILTIAGNIDIYLVNEQASDSEKTKFVGESECVLAVMGEEAKNCVEAIYHGELRVSPIGLH